MPDQPSDASATQPLSSWEFQMTGDEAIHRQIHPRFYDSGVISANAFAAREQEERKLSATRASKVGVQAAISHYTTVLQLKSAGAAELLVPEVEEEGARCIDDSADPANELPPGHCYVDFRGLTSKERRDLRDALAEIATERGLILKAAGG